MGLISSASTLPSTAGPLPIGLTCSEPGMVRANKGLDRYLPRQMRVPVQLLPLPAQHRNPEPVTGLRGGLAGWSPRQGPEQSAGDRRALPGKRRMVGCARTATSSESHGSPGPHEVPLIASRRIRRSCRCPGRCTPASGPGSSRSSARRLVAACRSRPIATRVLGTAATGIRLPRPAAR